MSRSSGDLIVDRRYTYAEGLLLDGEFAAAADLLEQTVALAPTWAPGWVALGSARERQGDTTGALAAFSHAAAVDPAGLYGGALHRARLGGGALAEMSEAFVAALFDDYAPRFDRHLVGDLGYRGPQLLVAALDAVAGGRRFAAALDLGCGTGLMGVAIRSRTDRLAGVDLSPAMVAIAGRTGAYDALAVDELHRALDAQGAASADLILAADVFGYVGPLERTMPSVARVLDRGGLAAFTVQRGEGEAAKLGADMRFSHPAAAVERAIAEAGLATLRLAEASTRRDAGTDVPGLVVVAQKP